MPWSVFWESQDPQRVSSGGRRGDILVPAWLHENMSMAKPAPHVTTFPSSLDPSHHPKAGSCSPALLAKSLESLLTTRAPSPNGGMRLPCCHVLCPSHRDSCLTAPGGVLCWPSNSHASLLGRPDRFPALFAGCWFEVDAVKKVPGCTGVIAALRTVAIEI